MQEPNVIVRHRLSVHDIEQMLNVGLLADEPVELIDGELIRMNAQGAPHAMLTVWIHRLLERTYGPGFYVRDHSPLQTSQYDLPEPDLALIRGEPQKTATRHPTSADTVLVIEVSFTSRAADRRKAGVYGRGAVAEYWLVDPASRRLEVRKAPDAAGEYQVTHLLDEDATVQWPGRQDSIAVRQLLPDA